MRLKRLDIFGFKSFCERTTVLFEPGITAIVGPNGCGKSNIADSILWVLGEQSPRTLRGDRMEDVIFNGSETRRPLGMAEVSLTLEEVEPSMDNALSRYREVCITRRLFRSGESEYLINKAPCRLKDIRDLLMDLGASFKGHGVLEQGKVDELVTASPQERRAIIEETAGITKYKIRRAEAERKLEATQQNLLRVRDIIAEVKRQLNHLERQAKKAKTYQELRSQVQDLELRLSVHEGRTLSGVLENTKKEYLDMQSQEAQRLAQRAQQEAQVEVLKSQSQEAKQILEAAKQSLYTLEAQILASEHKMAAITGQQKEWQDQTVHLESEIRLLDEGILEGQNRLGLIGQQIQSLNDEITMCRAQLAELESQVQALELQIREVSVSLEEVRRQVFDHQSGMIGIKNQITEGELRIAEIRRRMEKTAGQREQLESEYTRIEGSSREQEQSLTEQRQRIAQLKNELLAKQEQLEQLRLELSQRESLLAAKRRDLQDRKVRHAMLVDHLEKRLSLQEGARELLTLKSPKPMEGCHGVLGDYLETQPGYEKALEAVLRERLSGLVMEGRQATAAALGLLKEQGAGEATFIPLAPRGLSSAGEVMSQAEALKGTQSGVRGHVLSFVQVREEFQPVIEAFLADVLVVQDVDSAFSLWEDQAWAGSFVTLEGEVLESSGVLYGRSPRTEKKGLLQQRRDLKTLEEAAAQLEQEVITLEQNYRLTSSQITALTTAIEDLIRRLHDFELDEVEQVKKLEFLQQDLRRVEENIDLLRLEQQQAAQEEIEVRETMARLATALDEASQKKMSLEATLQSYQNTQEMLGAQKEGLQAQVTQLKIALSGFQEKRASLQHQQEELSQHLVEQREQLSAKRQRLENLANRQQASEREKEELVQAIGRLTAERASLIHQIQTRSEAVSDLEEQLKALEGAHRLCQSELEEIQRRVRETEVRLAEARMRLDHIQGVIASLSHKTLEQALQEMGEFQLQEEETRSSLNELKVRLEAMEPVNLAALDEHRELSERYEFLTRQEQDLTQSIDSLQKAIAKVNQTIRSLFMETFETLNAKFGEMFVQFFEGGSAKLMLLDEQNPLESGLEIVAQPPGKRLRHIQLLSGGEKALTAISLLFASFLIHPGPFCLLDEIDAALDEENVRRFTRVLRSLSEQSQFILVTHNKRTMEMADILYGITMEEPGASKLVSVKLGEMVGQPAV